MEYKGFVIFDMDGVLADCSHRLKFYDTGDKDRFYSDEEVIKDSPIHHGLALERMFFEAGYKIIVVSSRRYSCFNATIEWLKNNNVPGIDEKNVYLKPKRKFGKSWDIKKELVEEVLKNNPDLVGKNNYFIDDFAKNCEIIEAVFNIQTLVFGLKRLGDKRNY